MTKRGVFVQTLNTTMIHILDGFVKSQETRKVVFSLEKIIL